MGKLIAMSAATAALILSLACSSKSSESGNAPSGGDCPDGASMQGEAPPKGTAQWCAKDGKKHGPWTEWHEGGSLKTRGQYANGKMEGHWVTYHRPTPAKDEAQDEAKAAAKPADGEPPAEAAAQPARPETPPAPKPTAKPGERIKKEEGDYEGGMKTGLWIMYYEDGSKNREKTHTLGSTKIPWVAFRQGTGEKWAEGTIEDMRNHGPYKEYHPGGKLAAEGTYDKGEKAGEWKYWDGDGNPSTEPQGDLDQ